MRYTEHESQFVRDNIKSMSRPEIAAALNRPVHSIANFIKKEELRSGYHWTQKESQYVLDHYKDMTYSQMSEVLGKNPSAIRRYARENLSLEKYGDRTWSEEEDQFLLDNVNGVMSHRQIAEYLDRTVLAVSSRVYTLGLTTGKTGGYWTSNGDHLINPRPYYGSDWLDKRRTILERDNFTCQDPDCDEGGNNLQIHHIVRRKLTMDDSLNNLVALCNPHHGIQKTHQWESFSYDMLELLPEYQQFIYNGGNI